MFVGNRQSPAIKGESLQFGRPPHERRQGKAETLGATLLVKLGKEQAGQIRERLRPQEIELHEAFDRRLARPVGVAQRASDGRLMIEAQALLGPSGDKVQVATYCPEESLSALEAAILLGGQQSGVDQLRWLGDAIEIFANPVERMQVAQAALAVLDVRLDDVPAVAHFEVPAVAFFKLGGDEFGAGTGDDRLSKACGAGIEQGLVAPDPARFEESCADGNVVARERDQLIPVTDCMPDLPIEVPQHIERG